MINRAEGAPTYHDRFIYRRRKRILSAKRMVKAKTRTDAETQPIVMKSIRAKALTGVRPPSSIPTSNRGIEVRARTERLAIVGWTTASKALRKKG